METASESLVRASCVLPDRYDANNACVYVVEADNGEIKVGVSRTPYERLSKIRRHYASRRGFRTATLYAFVETDVPMAVEWMAHRDLKPYWAGGEWFTRAPEAALRVVLEYAMLASRYNVRVVRP